MPVRTSLTSSVSTPTLRMIEKKKTETSENEHALAKLSSPTSLKGIVTETSSRKHSENKKAMISCSMEPGMMSTEKPTRKSFFQASSSSHHIYTGS